MQNANITNLFNVLNIMLNYNINSIKFELFSFQNQTNFYYFWFTLHSELQNIQSLEVI